MFDFMDSMVDKFNITRDQITREAYNPSDDFD
jgi:hypothetical protein